MVSVRSFRPGMAASISMSLSRSRRTERLAAGEADLLDALGDEDAGEAGDLLEGQDLAAGQELVVAAEDLLRHAVGAAEVAAVGDGDAQVVQRPPQRVGAGAPLSVRG